MKERYYAYRVTDISLTTTILISKPCMIFLAHVLKTSSGWMPFGHSPGQGKNYRLSYYGCVIHIFIRNFLSKISFEKQERACTCKLQTQVRSIGPSLTCLFWSKDHFGKGPMLLTCVWSLHVHARSCFSNEISERKFRTKVCMTPCNSGVGRVASRCSLSLRPEGGVRG